MNLPEIYSHEERAIDTVVSVINRAKEMVGTRQTLKQLAGTRDYYASPPKVPLTSLGDPLAVTSEKLIADTIEKKWNLTKTFKYLLKYKGSSRDECMQYFYFEAIFSQPSPAYPVPQATASVFFRVEDKLILPPETRGKQKLFGVMVLISSDPVANGLKQYQKKVSVLKIGHNGSEHKKNSEGGVGKISYRIEGHHSDHDIRYILLPAEWLLAVIMMKIKLFKKIESYNVF